MKTITIDHRSNLNKRKTICRTAHNGDVVLLIVYCRWRVAVFIVASYCHYYYCWYLYFYNFFFLAVSCWWERVLWLVFRQFFSSHRNDVFLGPFGWAESIASNERDRVSPAYEKTEGRSCGEDRVCNTTAYHQKQSKPITEKPSKRQQRKNPLFDYKIDFFSLPNKVVCKIHLHFHWIKPTEYSGTIIFNSQKYLEHIQQESL